MNTRQRNTSDLPHDLPDDLAMALRRLRAEVPPERDLWPAIAARLAAPQSAADRHPAPSIAEPTPRTTPPVSPAPHRYRRHRRRNAAYATAAAVVFALVAAWPLLPLREVIAPAPPVPGGDALATNPGAPLLQAADALAREYQGALREVRASAGAAGIPPPPAATDAELERSATEVRAALARDPDALHLFHRLQRIYSHRLALNLRQA